MRLVCQLFWGIWVCYASVASAQVSEWSQWGGPNRDHKSLETGLLKSWPEGGPDLAWKYDSAGIGFSSFSCVDGRLYTLCGINGQSVVLCLDVNTGKELWKIPFATAPGDKSYNGNWGLGPRSTPTIAGERLVAVDDGGVVVCINLATQSVLWKRSLVEDFGGAIPTWGYSASPLIDGNRVIVCPGMKNFLVALDLESGETILQSQGYDEKAHYVSVMKHSVDGISLYTTATSAGLVSFDPKTGKVLWTNKVTGNRDRDDSYSDHQRKLAVSHLWLRYRRAVVQAFRTRRKDRSRATVWRQRVQKYAESPRRCRTRGW